MLISKKSKSSYNVFRPKKNDILKIAILSLLIDMIILYLFYKNIIICIITYPLCFLFVFRAYGKSKVAKRKRIFEGEFEEFLSCISSLLATGYSLENTIHESVKEMGLLYEKDTDIMREIAKMRHGLKMNIPVEKLFKDMAIEADIDDITTFAEMAAITKRSGGDLISIVKQTLEVIHGKREVYNEINTMIAAKKFENRILNLMPVIMLVFLSVFSVGYLDVLYNNPAGIGVMTIGLAIYAGSWVIGSRIMNIDSYSSRIKEKKIRDGKKDYSGDIKEDRIYRLFKKFGFKEKIDVLFHDLGRIYPSEKTRIISLIWWKDVCKNTLTGSAAGMLIIILCAVFNSENLPYIIMVSLVISFGIPYYYVGNIKKQIKKRDEQMIMDYPDCINRFILLLGTGINMRSAWERICADYRKKRSRGGGIHYVYEEMLYSAAEMKNGIPEAEAYERFGRRIKLLPYMKLSAMLGQNLKKGNRRMIEQLHLTSIDALVHRRETMKRLGEEASSKLLLPMMLQFILILLIVMYPAIRTL